MISRLSVENVAEHLRCRRIAPLLVPYADDRLRRAERERVEAHLQHCPACRAEVQTIAGVGALLRDASSQAPAPVVDLSPNLWAGIEAEIRRGGVPLDRSAESPMLRPRRRAGFAWDAAWPSSIPVATAVFSAIVFGTVLLNHHALIAPANSGGANHAKSDAAITVAMRPVAPTPALAGAPVDAPGAMPSSAAARAFLAHAQPPASQAQRSIAVPASMHRAAPMTSKDVLVAALLNPVAALNPAAAPKAAPFFGLAFVAAPPHAGSIAASPASTASRKTGTALAEAGTPIAPIGKTAALGVETQPRLGDAAHFVEASASDTSTLAMAKSTEPAATVTPLTTEPTMPVTSAAPAASDSVALISTAKPDDDATVRSGAPADQPMADFAAISRRQRNLFSYTSR